MTLLAVRAVEKRFGRVPVLTGASMEVGPGELVGVAGENGSGKSTLLQIVVGRLSRDAGSVELRGRVAWCPQRSLVFAGWLQNPILYAEAQNRAIIRGLPAHFPSQAAMAAAFTGEPVGYPLAGSLAYGLALLAVALGVYGCRMRRR